MAAISRLVAMGRSIKVWEIFIADYRVSCFEETAP
jgi:hypothetical protein